MSAAVRFVARLGLLLSLACAFGAAVAAEPANPRQTWQLLDYIAVDYAGAVQGGQVVAPAEYAEMREFAATVRTQLSALPATPAQTELIAQADQLVATVEAKAEAHTVAAAAHRLADALLKSYPIAAVPSTPPDPARAASLYGQQCAGCHGASGRGDGPAAASLNQQANALVQTVAVFQLPHDAPAGSATTQRIAPQAQRTPGLLPARA